jgi:Cu/Ag efflux protein CusF
MKGRLSRWLLCLVLVPLAGTSRLALGADKPNEFVQDQKKDLEFTGSITGVDTNALTVTINNKEKGAMTFSIAKDCLLFVKHKKGAAALTDFKVGEAVKALYRQQNNTLVCQSMWQPGSHPREKEHKIEQ